ncbi:MAG: hypothetical protein BMS9Abin13_249 [Patescibacteria group bacterium]|nr:MAG: hypothetical protein BMS9Abin13_249 [Patescibacteria group bacterium]
MACPFIYPRNKSYFVSGISFFTPLCFAVKCFTLAIMSVRMRHTRAHTANRRSHHALKVGRLSICYKCGASHLRHRVCPTCGSYRGREIIDVMKSVEKKAQRKKEKMKQRGIQEHVGEKETTEKLNAAALSDKQ